MLDSRRKSAQSAAASHPAHLEKTACGADYGLTRPRCALQSSPSPQLPIPPDPSPPHPEHRTTACAHGPEIESEAEAAEEDLLHGPQDYTCSRSCCSRNPLQCTGLCCRKGRERRRKGKERGEKEKRKGNKQERKEEKERKGRVKRNERRVLDKKGQGKERREKGRKEASNERRKEEKVRSSRDMRKGLEMPRHIWDCLSTEVSQASRQILH